MATWTTSSRREAAGIVTVTITYPSGSNLDMEVLEIGSIAYEFDIPENNQESRSIAAIIGDSNISIRDILSDGSSAYDKLVAAVNPVDYQTKIEVIANSGTTYEFQFYFNKLDVSTDDKTRITNIKLKPLRFSENTVADYFDSGILDSDGSAIVPTTVDGYLGSTGNKVTFAGDFIDDMLKTIDHDGTFVLKTKNSRLSTLAGASSGQNYTLLGDDSQLASGAITELFGINSTFNCFEAVGILAATEGAIYGSGFGYNFFVNRKDQSDNVELTYNDVEDLKAVTTDRQFRSITVNDGITTDIKDYSPYASKNFSYTPPPTNNVAGIRCMFTGKYDGTNTDPTFQQVSGNADAAVEAYATAFSADDSKHIEAVIFGFDKVLPHKTLKFDTSVPTRYRNAVYRMSSVEYSIEEDMITVKAYQID